MGRQARSSITSDTWHLIAIKWKVNSSGKAIIYFLLKYFTFTTNNYVHNRLFQIFNEEINISFQAKNWNKSDKIFM